MAAEGDRRSLPIARAPRVELRFVPTGSVFGTVKRVGDRVGQIHIAAMLLPLDSVEFLAPIAADGSWRIDRVPRGKVTVVAAFGYEPRELRFREIVVGAKPVGPIAFELANVGIPIHVVIRSQFQTPIAMGLAFVVRGKFTAKVLGDLEKVTTPMLRSRAFLQRAEDADPAVRSIMKPGDVATRLPSVAPGDITLCGVGITGELSDQSYMRKIEKHANSFDVACKPVTITKPDQVIVIEVPPMKRLPDD
jgi:hypothetical protein